MKQCNSFLRHGTNIKAMNHANDNKTHDANGTYGTIDANDANDANDKHENSKETMDSLQVNVPTCTFISEQENELLVFVLHYSNALHHRADLSIRYDARITQGYKNAAMYCSYSKDIESIPAPSTFLSEAISKIHAKKNDSIPWKDLSIVKTKAINRDMTFASIFRVETDRLLLDWKKCCLESTSTSLDSKTRQECNSQEDQRTLLSSNDHNNNIDSSEHDDSPEFNIQIFQRICTWLGCNSRIINESFLEYYNEVLVEGFASYLPEKDNYKELLAYLYKLHSTSKVTSSLMSTNLSQGEKDVSLSFASYTAFSILCTIIERVVASIFLSVSKRKKSLPHLLSDILDTTEVIEVLGSDALTIIRCFIGPPSGLNLRNIVWHGFIHPSSEFDINYCGVCFMILLTILHDSMKYFEEKTLPFTWKSCFNPIDKYEIHSVRVLDIPHEIFCDIVENSFFVLEDRKALLKKSILLLKQGSYLAGMSILLPQMEHLLRCLFVTLHHTKVPIGMLVAKSTELFTTLNLILSNTTSDGYPNEIGTYLGEGIFSSLKDIFIFNSELRLRDRIAHHDISWKDIPPSFIENTLGCFIVICMKLPKSLTRLEQQLRNHSKLQSAWTFYRDYISLFYPKSIVIQTIYNLHEKVVNASNCFRNINHSVQEEKGLKLIFSSTSFLISNEERQEFQSNLNVRDLIHSIFIPNTLNTVYKQELQCLSNHLKEFLDNQLVKLNNKNLCGLPFVDSALKKLDVHAPKSSQLLDHNIADIVEGELYSKKQVSLLKYVQYNCTVEDYEFLDASEKRMFLSNVKLCSMIINKIVQLISIMQGRFEILYKLLFSKKGRSKHRKQYATLKALYPILMNIVSLTMILIENFLLYHKKPICEGIHPPKYESCSTYHSSSIETSNSPESHIRNEIVNNVSGQFACIAKTQSLQDIDIKVHHKKFERVLTAMERLVIYSEKGEFGVGIHKFMAIYCKYIATM